MNLVNLGNICFWICSQIFCLSHILLHCVCDETVMKHHKRALCLQNWHAHRFQQHDSMKDEYSIKFQIDWPLTISCWPAEVFFNPLHTDMIRISWAYNKISQEHVQLLNASYPINLKSNTFYLLLLPKSWWKSFAYLVNFHNLPKIFTLISKLNLFP
jgi:hypothetical protein